MAIRWGIIGCGNVTEVKSGPGFQKAAGSELAMVMRRDVVKAEDYAQATWCASGWTTDADALIQDAGIDAVYVATPLPARTWSMLLKIAAAGKPVYIEKPDGTQSMPSVSVRSMRLSRPNSRC